MRLHQPVGIWLLLWPCLWAIALASGGQPSLWLIFLFILGAVLMRGAGCIINDMADREFDKQVERTRTRPLASGELTIKQARILLATLLAASAVIACLMGVPVIICAALSLIPVSAYPFMKRITWWPQAFLGLTFNWGAILGWVAATGRIELAAIALYAGCFFWTIGYDTIYAHQDKHDDARIGVKSTALLLGSDTKKIVGICYMLAVIEWAIAGWMAGCGMAFFIVLMLAALHLGWQVREVDIDDPASCRRIFISNTRFGWLIFLASCIGFIF